MSVLTTLVMWCLLVKSESIFMLQILLSCCCLRINWFLSELSRDIFLLRVKLCKFSERIFADCRFKFCNSWDLCDFSLINCTRFEPQCSTFASHEWFISLHIVAILTNIFVKLTESKALLIKWVSWTHCGTKWRLFRKVLMVGSPRTCPDKLRTSSSSVSSSPWSFIWSTPRENSQESTENSKRRKLRRKRSQGWRKKSNRNFAESGLHSEDFLGFIHLIFLKIPGVLRAESHSRPILQNSSISENNFQFSSLSVCAKVFVILNEFYHQTEKRNYAFSGETILTWILTMCLSLFYCAIFTNIFSAIMSTI